MIRLIRIAKSQFKELSFCDFISRVKDSLFRTEPILVYLLQLDHIDELEPSNQTEELIQKGKVAELDLISHHSGPIPWEFQCHRYDGVKDFFIARDGEGIQHISWIYYRYDPNRILRLAALDAEIKYCLTLPPFRGRGLYPKALQAIARHLKGKGFRRLFISVNKDNHASIRGIEKTRFRYVAKVHVTKILGFQFSRRFIPPKEVDYRVSE